MNYLSQDVLDSVKDKLLEVATLQKHILKGCVLKLNTVKASTSSSGCGFDIKVSGIVQPREGPMSIATVKAYATVSTNDSTGEIETTLHRTVVIE